jgi:hypothetical protein
MTWKKEILSFLKDVRDDFDHDEYAHRYNTQCLQCDATTLLKKYEKELTE